VPGRADRLVAELGARVRDTRALEAMRDVDRAAFVPESESPTKALVVVIIYVAIHQIEAHLISPMVMARSVKLHPVVVILAVLAMGELLGLAGIVLAVPAAATLTVLLEELYVKQLGETPAPLAAEVAQDGEPPGGGAGGEREPARSR